MAGEHAASEWHNANQQYLMEGVRAVRRGLERYIAGRTAPGTSPADRDPPDYVIESRRSTAADEPPFALDEIGRLFGLSSFERGTLLLCAGVELDAGVAALCSDFHGTARGRYATFGMALAVIPDAHWTALTPHGPLRRWQLLELEDGGALTSAPLRVDERVLHYLAGVHASDVRLSGVFTKLTAPPVLPASHCRVVDRVVSMWGHIGRNALPLVHLCGDNAEDKAAIAAAAARSIGLSLSVVPGEALPAAPAEADLVARLWQREAALTASALLVDCAELSGSEAGRWIPVVRFVQTIGAPVFVASRERRRFGERRTVSIDVVKPTRQEQRAVWRASLDGVPGLGDEGLDRLTAQFSLAAEAIRTIGGETDRGPTDASGSGDNRGQVWEACRAYTRPRLDELAQHIDPAAGWEDLVLPDPQLELLRDIVAQVRNRTRVYEAWGLGRGPRGLGITALFAGVSGTGKTMAAEVLARDLSLDLYRVDLSSVVSKYIGETEKNLRRVFDAAEDGGVVLLFDEADAIFGKRTEVRDSHDRYANMEVSYLLQRMENYRGLAILTSNFRRAIDAAFLRRLRFIVEFPFPDAAHRAAIWRRALPFTVPTAGIDFDLLAQLDLAGGHIRNLALRAAFLAAEQEEPVRMDHLRRAAELEYSKLERPLTTAETEGWTEAAAVAV